MNELLYIDGQLVDLGDGVNITLNYKSNMLTDLSKIVGNNSYTIKLPKTMRNLSIIGMSDVPSVVSSFPREYHECRYFRNGVEIIPNGKAVLMGVGDSIEIVITWGGASALFRLIDEGKKLNEFTNSNDWVYWTKNASPYGYTGNDNILFSDIDMGIKSESELAALHPCVRSTYVLDLIKAEYGLDITFPSERESFIKRLIIPLLTTKGGRIQEMMSMLKMTYESNDNISMTSPYGWVVTEKGQEMTSYFKVNEFDFDDFIGNEIVMNVTVKTDCHLVFTPDIHHDSPDVKIQYGSDVLENELFFPYTIEREGVYVFNTPVELDLSEGDAFRIATNFVDYGSTISVVSKPNSIKVGDRFPIIENLPDIKVIEFLKSLASLSGTFVTPSNDGNSISFVPFDVLKDIGSCVDWSNSLLSADSFIRPMNIVYSLEDFARNNNMLWKEDDTVNIIANGSIKVDDDTIELERDAVQLPFAASDMTRNRAKIKLYVYNDEDKPELQDVEPRILVEKDVNGYSTGSFDGLHWSTLISKYYQSYQDAVRKPVIITENIRLNELSLRDLNVAKPVYLRQYGKYYAVVEVKASSNGVCECKLLQLD